MQRALSTGGRSFLESSSSELGPQTSPAPQFKQLSRASFDGAARDDHERGPIGQTLPESKVLEIVRTSRSLKITGISSEMMSFPILWEMFSVSVDLLSG